MVLPIQRLEAYTLAHPQEVLLVQATVPTPSGPEADQVMVFRGFSSSLMGATAVDPTVPVLPETAVITTIDRYQSPYHPKDSQPLEQGIPWETFAQRLP